MAETQLTLLKSRRFLPLFVTQFPGAVNDNLLKVGLVTLITFRPITDPHTTRSVVSTTRPAESSPSSWPLKPVT